MTGEQAKWAGLGPEDMETIATAEPIPEAPEFGLVLRRRIYEIVRDLDGDHREATTKLCQVFEEMAGVGATWRCFRCDFSTSDPVEAAAHFGERDDAEDFLPFCSWWAKLNADDRARHAQQLQSELTAEQEESARLSMKCEGLEYRLVDVENLIDSRFPGCRSLNDISNLYHTMEGRALAAEKLWDFLETRGVLSVILADGTEIDPSTDTLRGAVCRLYEAEVAKGKRE